MLRHNALVVGIAGFILGSGLTLTIAQTPPGVTNHTIPFAPPTLIVTCALSLPAAFDNVYQNESAPSKPAAGL